MSNFQLDRRFGLIYVADNSFRELNTKQQQRSCLKCVYHHLQPDGKFLVTERRFDRSKFVNGRRQFQWSKPIRHPGSGNMVQRKVETQLRNCNNHEGRYLIELAAKIGLCDSVCGLKHNDLTNQVVYLSDQMLNSAHRGL